MLIYDLCSQELLGFFLENEQMGVVWGVRSSLIDWCATHTSVSIDI